MERKIKVLTIFGTRPEASKMAPLVLELRKRPQIETLCCVTAQHREMLDQVLEIFHIRPDYDLNVMKPGQTLSDVTSAVLNGLGDVLDEIKPDLALVHGDTSTAFSSALACFYRKITVGHVEAGLRTYDKYSPFPEEINRQLISRIAGLNFCPTPRNRRNLLDEKAGGRVYLTGNTAIDTVKLLARDDYSFQSETLRQIDFSRSRFIWLETHRRENLGRPMENILLAVRRLLEDFSDVEVIWPVHRNPVVREAAEKYLAGVERAHLIDPLPVDDNLNLIRRCALVMTDSGGLQEEAPALGKPVLVLRRETERPEAVEAGTVKLAGTDENEIYSLAAELLSNPAAYRKMAHTENPYGDGNASRRIADAILYEFGLGEEPSPFEPAP